MARKEAIFKATIDTGSSVNDVKNLDKELEGLNSELKDLTKNGQTNTQEFKDLSKAYEEARTEVKKLAGDMEHLGDERIERGVVCKYGSGRGFPSVHRCYCFAW